MCLLDGSSLRAFGVQVLLEVDAQLFPHGLQLFQVLVVLAVVLHLGLDACGKDFRQLGLIIPLICGSDTLRLTLEYPHCSGKVVDPAGGAQSGGDDRWRGHKIVRERVVEVALQLEHILHLLKLLLVSVIQKAECQPLNHFTSSIELVYGRARELNSVASGCRSLQDHFLTAHSPIRHCRLLKLSLIVLLLPVQHSFELEFSSHIPRGKLLKALLVVRVMRIVVGEHPRGAREGRARGQWHAAHRRHAAGLEEPCPRDASQGSGRHAGELDVGVRGVEIGDVVVVGFFNDGQALFGRSGWEERSKLEHVGARGLGMKGVVTCNAIA